jgi:predicted esterase
VQDIEGTPAGPYLVHHPTPGNPDAATVVFVPGGSGSWTSAQRIWTRFVSGDPRVQRYRVVIPYSYSEDFIDDARRTFGILDEVLACYGGDAAKVHLAGYSNGGRAAFGLMLSKPDRFATLLGAPGVLPTTDRTILATALACRGRAVFNGVGELDDGWKALVRESHQALLDAGVDSVYVEFPGETHRLSEKFNGGVFFDFWAKH